MHARCLFQIFQELSIQGNAGDSLTIHNGMTFTTKDRDNDKSNVGNCAVSYQGAWWYNMCHVSNLNGLYLKEGVLSASSVSWLHWKGERRSLKKSEMKVRPAQF